MKQTVSTLRRHFYDSPTVQPQRTPTSPERPPPPQLRQNRHLWACLRFLNSWLFCDLLMQHKWTQEVWTQ